MSYLSTPFPVAKGGTGAASASGARTALSVPLNTNTMLLDGTQAMAANLQMGSNRITGLADPSGAQDAATKAYVDASAVGIDWKPSCRVATTASITLSGAQTIDGISVVAADRVLVKNQSTASQNGLYLCASGSWTRTTDADANAEVTAGLAVFIEEGTVNADTGWLLTTDGAITVGTTSLTFTQFTGIGSLIDGNGLVKTGNTIDVVGTANRIVANANSIDIDSNYAGQSTITILGIVVTGTWQGTKVDIPYGGTNAITASGARSNLAAAPATPIYWVGANNSEIANAVVPNNGTGININAATAQVSVDTSVVLTTSNAVTATNKTFTSPVLNTPKIVDTVRVSLDADTTMVVTDTLLSFLATAQRTCTLPAGSSSASIRYTIKNKKASTFNVVVTRAGSDTIENANTTWTLAPGDSVDIEYDGSEWVIL